ncbi:MAG: prepilin-type N-terminal cleavage/methylation domain-containing protein [Candidatus Eremiobacteraeota bacterium]|nr:prepilin-type N-terminal cleavage/methylation domain-containing protein [Candidatus Eremiobacteraeota bacterium]
MFQRNGRKNVKGFTLAEFVIVIAALAILLGALANITIGGLNAYRKGITQTDMKQQLRKVMYSISTDIRQAVPAQGISGFISPQWDEDATDPVIDLHFNRFIADDTDPLVVDETSPDTVEVQYLLMQDVDNPGKYLLRRTEIHSGSGDTYISTLADDLVVNTGSPANLQTGCYFMWATNGMDPTKADYNTLIVRMLIEKPVVAAQGGKETLDMETSIALRTNLEPVSGSTWGGNLQPFLQFGSYMEAPSSLVDPR